MVIPEEYKCDRNTSILEYNLQKYVGYSQNIV